MKLHITEHDLRKYLQSKSLSETIFDEIKALHRDDGGKVRLDELNPGGRFRYGGVEWVKLDGMGDASLCLATECVTKKAFDEANDNDWRTSSLREWLNNHNRAEYDGGFLGQLIESGGAKMEDFAFFRSDLTADDGMRDYGVADDIISLLSCDLYRKYRDAIPSVDDWCWTLTPWTCIAAYSYNVRGVNASGTLAGTYAFNGSRGVRPLCNLKSDILVSCVE